VFNGLPSCPTTVWDGTTGLIKAGPLICVGDNTGTGGSLPLYNFETSFEFGSSVSGDAVDDSSSGNVTITTSLMDQYMRQMLRGVVISARYLPDPAQESPDATQISTAVYLLTRPNAVYLQNWTDMDLVVTGAIMSSPPDITCFSSTFTSQNLSESAINVMRNVTDFHISPNSNVYILNSGQVLPNTGNVSPANLQCSIPIPAGTTDDSALQPETYVCPTNTAGSNRYRTSFTAVASTLAPNVNYGAGTFTFVPDGTSTVTTNESSSLPNAFTWPIYQQITVTDTQQYLTVAVYIPVTITNNTPYTMEIFYVNNFANICSPRTVSLDAGEQASMPFAKLEVMMVSFFYNNNPVFGNLQFPATSNRGTQELMDAPLVCVPLTPCASGVACTCPGTPHKDCESQMMYSDANALAYGANRFYAYGDVSSGISKTMSITMPTVSVVNSTASKQLNLVGVFPTETTPVEVKPGSYASVSVADLANLKMYYVDVDP
jgi:hypothetical protein